MCSIIVCAVLRTKQIRMILRFLQMLPASFLLLPSLSLVFLYFDAASALSDPISLKASFPRKAKEINNVARIYFI